MRPAAHATTRGPHIGSAAPGAGGAAPGRGYAPPSPLPRDNHCFMSKIVLVIEHDPSIGSMVRSVLLREGYEVEVVKNRDEALSRVSEKRYDALVIDVTTRESSGYEVLEMVATDRPDVKCVVVMSSGSPKAIAEINAANIEAKLRKPFDIQELTAAVRRAVGLEPPAAKP